MSSEATNLAGEQGQGGFVVPVEVKFINNTIGHGVFAVDPIKKGTLLWTSKCVACCQPHYRGGNSNSRSFISDGEKNLAQANVCTKRRSSSYLLESY